MKILSVSLSNFASYKELEFTFDDQGLVLIHGATGSGKSTLMDAIPWILFGKTAKGGNADEVISWPGNKCSVGVIKLKSGYSITRTRNNNDLYYLDGNSVMPIRGKDLADTQKLINQILGFDYDMYMASAYYHEFSQTAQFFTTTARNRRQITEQLVDLSLPLKLSESVKADQKQLKSDIQDLDKTQYKAKVNFEVSFEQMQQALLASQQWGMQQATKIQALQLKSDSFEVTKNLRIKALEKQIVDIDYDPIIATSQDPELLLKDLPPESLPCETCGVPKPNLERKATLEAIQELKDERKDHQTRGKQVKALEAQLNDIKSSNNTYQEQIRAIKNETNPHTTNQLKHEKNTDKYEKEVQSNQIKLNAFKDKELNLELLSDAVTTLRSELVKNTIDSLETQTNTLLQDHFESEIQVRFNIAESDKLEVIITKDSNEAAYTQLSKGQRCILKLAFGIAVMKTISKHNNLDIKQLFFDESLDGMDDTNKLRSVKLFETLALEYDTIYIVEHSSEVKAHIDQKYFVELINGSSTIEKV